MQTAKVNRYYTQYATLKVRGYEKKKAMLTIHKQPVRKPGYECEENVIDIETRKPVGEKELTEDEKDARFKSSLLRSKSAVLQLAFNNPWEYFTTFTFDQKKVVSRYDYKELKRQITQFFNNYAKRGGADTGFKYLIVPELHKDGAIHFHGLLHGVNTNDMVKNKNGYYDFVPYCERFGFCQMGKIADTEKCAVYISKYISKEMLGSFSYEPNTHLYFASKGLKKDEILLTGACVYSVNDFINAGYDVFENEYCAKVETDDIEHAKTFIQPYENTVPAEIRHTMLRSMYEQYKKEKEQREEEERLRKDPYAWAEIPKRKNLYDLEEYRMLDAVTKKKFESWQIERQMAFSHESGGMGL